MRINLNNQKALVTSGSGDLGRTIARTLAQCGADVAIHYNSNSCYVEKLAAEIKTMGRNLAVIKADIITRYNITSYNKNKYKNFLFY